MKKANHTRGTWQYELVFNLGEGTYAINKRHEDDSRTQEIAQLTRADSKRNGCDYNAEVEEANARLISAAPNMLSALECAKFILLRYTPMNDGVSAAISIIESALIQAKGE